LINHSTLLKKLKNKKLCKILHWDSKHFNLRIGKIFTFEYLDNLQFENINTWANTNNINCIYYLKRFNNNDNYFIEKKYGYKHIVNRIEMSKDLPSSLEKNQIHNSGLSILELNKRNIDQFDYELLKYFTESRFYKDENFDQQKVESMYLKWMKNHCFGQSSNVLIAKDNNRVLGFITYQILDNYTGKIGLFATNPKYRGAGVGKSLLISCEERLLSEKNIKFLKVVTQESNINGFMFYKKNNFKINRKNIWFHKWFS
tara:strand:- start:329 stop:1102 length:774 start_codon:yes stop_codon:yes gene_type:complete